MQQRHPILPGSYPTLPRWAHFADAAVLALLLVALSMVNTDGFVVYPFGVRMSVKSEWRLFAWAGLLLLVRHWLVPSPSLYLRVASAVRDAARSAGPLPDDAELLGWPDRAVPAISRGRRRRAFGAAIALLVGFAALTAWMTYPQVQQWHGVSRDLGDPLFSTWRLSWFAHQLPRDPLRLFDGNIFHPEPTTLAYSDAMLLPSLTIAPLVWLGLPQLPAYTVLLLSGFVFSGAAMFLLVRSLTRHTGAALVSAFIFAFLPYRFMHYAHLELQMAQWMPLCLWALHRTVDGGRLRDGLLTGLFLACQTLSSLYYGIFLATFLVPVTLVLLVGVDRARIVRTLRPLVAGVVLAGVLVAPLAAQYLAVRRSVGERPVHEIAFYSATPTDYLAAHPRNILMGDVTAEWGGQERELFLGIAVPIIALVGLWPPMSAVRIAYGLGFVLAFDMSLGLNGMTYPWLHEYLLPFRGLRVPARMAIVVGFSLAVLAGYGVVRLMARTRTRGAARALCLLLAALVWVEYRSKLVLRDVWATPPPVYASLEDRPPSVLLELPLIAPDISLEPIYMYFSTFHWHELVNGYSGFSPPSYAALLNLMTAFPDEASMAELRRRSVDFIIVHGAFLPPDDYDRLVNRLQGRSDVALVETSSWQGRETRLYRMTTSERRWDADASSKPEAENDRRPQTSLQRMPAVATASRPGTIRRIIGARRGHPARRHAPHESQQASVHPGMRGSRGRVGRVRHAWTRVRHSGIRGAADQLGRQLQVQHGAPAPGEVACGRPGIRQAARSVQGTGHASLLQRYCRQRPSAVVPEGDESGRGTRSGRTNRERRGGRELRPAVPVPP